MKKEKGKSKRSSNNKDSKRRNITGEGSGDA